MSRIRWVGIAENITTVSIPVDAESERVRQSTWHAFISGTLAGATVQIEYSPDTVDISDANSIWYSPTILQVTSTGDQFFWARPRKFRVFVNGGGLTTSVTVEIRA